MGALRRAVARPKTSDWKASLRGSSVPTGSRSSQVEMLEQAVDLVRKAPLSGEDFTEELVGTVQRLREIEEERRKLFEEYDEMFVRAASLSKPSPVASRSSPALSQSEALHAADGAAGAAGPLLNI